MMNCFPAKLLLIRLLVSFFISGACLQEAEFSERLQHGAQQKGWEEQGSGDETTSGKQSTQLQNQGSLHLSAGMILSVSGVLRLHAIPYDRRRTHCGALINLVAHNTAY